MNVTLITASFNDEVHGTFNDKRTGCGINLTKPENVTRYRRGAKMTDLGEITCEKCKTKVAKEMIKSDQKEMKQILKEEKLRAKKGLGDEGIVPLGNTTAKITKDQSAVQEPEPEKHEPKPAFDSNGAPVLDDDLAQFAIKKPEPVQEAPVHEHEPIHQPEPVQETAAPAAEDDFLAQFAIQKPVEEEPEPERHEEDDFLAQFAVSAPEKEEEPQPDVPETPPVLDDISAALEAIQSSPIGAAPKPVEEIPQPEEISMPEPIIEPMPAAGLEPVYIPEPEQAAEPEPTAAPVSVQELTNDDILSMFAINQPKPVDETPAPAPELVPEPVQETAAEEKATEWEAAMSEWDIIANQLFGDTLTPEPAAQPEPEAVVEHEAEILEEPEIEDIAIPEIPEVAQAEEPEIEDIVIPEIPEVAQVEEPEIEDIVIPEIPEVAKAEEPEIEETAAPVENDELILEDINEDEELEFIAENLEPKAPVIDDISAALSALSIPASKTEPVQQTVQQKPPVLDDISAALSALNTPVQPVSAPVQPIVPPVQPVAAPVQPIAAPVQPMAAPVQPMTAPIQPMVAPVQPMAAPVQPMTAPIQPMVAPVQPMAAPMQTAGAAGAVGQVISVPQLTGYNDSNQPIYTYVQMQIQGYDASGQPVLVPLPGQTIPAPFMPSSVDKNTRLRDAIAAAKEIPTSTREMTPGQRIAAANAASGAPVAANVSKIATNPHTKSTSRAFISAISESKEYANQSLTETQGLKQRAPVLSSVEDVLSQLGDNSLKEKKAAEARAQSNVPDFQEFRAPGRTSAGSRMASTPTPKPTAAPKQEERPLTKAELKARKKQEKIDAKFQKEMAKRK